MDKKQLYLDLIKELNLPTLITINEAKGKTFKEIKTSVWSDEKYLIFEEGYAVVVGVKRGYDNDVEPMFENPNELGYSDLEGFILAVADYNKETHIKLKALREYIQKVEEKGKMFN